jgi:hypothetical protein
MGALVIGLAFRLIRLGSLSLNNMEGALALQALTVARGDKALFGGHSAYAGLTGLSFSLFSSSNFLARFWPALVGALLVCLPLLFRDMIGHRPAALAAIVLAISPEMVGLSRIVGSPMMAMVFLLSALGFWLGSKPILAGMSLSLGLMSGPGFWVGVVMIGLSLALVEWLAGGQDLFSQVTDKWHKTHWTSFGLAFALTLLVVGTGFFLAPAGLRGVFAGLVDFILGFGQSRTASAGLIPFALLAYGAGAVIFGLWGGIRGMLIKCKLDQFLFIWAGLGLVFLLVYPASNPADLIWVTLPLWVLSARVTAYAWRKPESFKLVAAIGAVLVVVVFAFMLLAARTLVSPNLPQAQQINYLIALVGGVVLVVAVIFLINYGWTEEVARASLLLGLAVVFSAGMVSVSVNSTGIGPETPYTLWYPDEAVLIPEWLVVTIDRTLVWNARGTEPVSIAVAGLDTPGLRWAMRNYEPLDFVPYVPPQTQPGVVLTPLGVIPEISHGYQGQSLVWARSVPWRGLAPDQYLTWLITREVPTIPQEVILWVRTDLMPGGQTE